MGILSLFVCPLSRVGREDEMQRTWYLYPIQRSISLDVEIPLSTLCFPLNPRGEMNERAEQNDLSVTDVPSHSFTPSQHFACTTSTCPTLPIRSTACSCSKRLTHFDCRWQELEHRPEAIGRSHSQRISLRWAYRSIRECKQGRHAPDLIYVYACV